jgi:hypothetical protein
VNTLKQPNASRFFKGYKDKMAQHREENKDYYKSLYGESFLQENDKSVINVKTTAKKAGGRPSSAFPNRGALKRDKSARSIKSSNKEKERSKSRKNSARNLAKVYGEQNEQLLRYEREKELIKKRDETKAELKALLKKYITTRQ